jgi:hypothetical protein
MMTLKSGLRYHLVNRDTGLAMAASGDEPLSKPLSWSTSMGVIVSREDIIMTTWDVKRVEWIKVRVNQRYL